MSTDEIHQYLKIQNRPFSVNDIVTNHQQEFSKKTVEKALDKLLDRKKIIEKTYGKQKIYCIIQDGGKEPDELRRIQRELDQRLVEVMAKKEETEKQLRTSETELAALKSSLSIEDAKSERDRLISSVKELVKKFEVIVKSNGSKDLGETKKRVLKQTEIYTREFSKRKRLCGEIIECILEGFPGTKKKLYEEIGIETVDV